MPEPGRDLCYHPDEDFAKGRDIVVAANAKMDHYFRPRGALIQQGGKLGLFHYRPQFGKHPLTDWGLKQEVGSYSSTYANDPVTNSLPFYSLGERVAKDQQIDLHPQVTYQIFEAVKKA